MYTLLACVYNIMHCKCEKLLYYTIYSSSKGTKKHYFKLTNDLSHLLSIKKLQNLSPCYFKWRQPPFGLNLFRWNTAHLELFKLFYRCDQMRCFSRGANGSKSSTPLVAEQKGFPGECPTISKQSPGWISSLALERHWRMRIWVAYEKMKKDEASCF